MNRLLLTVAALSLVAGCNCGGTGVDPDGGSDGGGTGGGQGSLCLVPTSCYSGLGGTQNVGACKSGTAQCLANALGPCIGEVLPGAEACNGVDDDCNGSVDDGLGNVSCGLGACRVTINACNNGQPAACVPMAPTAEVCGNGIDDNCDGAVDEGCNCIYVAPGGSNTNAGTATDPVLTIAAGIGIAADAGVRQVCVAAGAVCPTTGAYNESVQMVNGISVFGAYQATADGGAWPRLPGCVSRITAQDDKGVYFGPSITSPTSIDGFNILASNSATNAAVTVEGATGAVINNNAILGGSGQTSVGINVIGSATPTISRNQITGGAGAQSSIGVRSSGAKPTIVDNCGAFNANGRCSQYCFNGARYIRGRVNLNTGATSYGVKLENSPGAVIERSALCSGQAATDAAGVRLSGDGTGTQIRASIVESFGAGTNAVGVWADDCANASPWIFDNTDLSGNSPIMGARADGIRAVGACHPRIDSNQRIIGGQESSNNDAIGVYCAQDPATGASSRCTVQNNVLISGSIAGVPPTSTGIRCDPGACALIERNRITGRGGVRTFGVVLDTAGTVVRKNEIEAGCATAEGIGLLSIDAPARVENNSIRGSVCSGVAVMTTPLSTGVKVLVGAGASELDLNSNTIPPFGSRAANCTSRGLVFDLHDAGTPAGARGVVRNNIISGGVCSSATPVFEADVATDPRIFESNDLYADGGVYLDEGSSQLPDIAAVNALGGAAANLSADPDFDGGVHLSSTSVCRNAGTATGAPSDDLDGDARPQESAHDIGADEYKP